LTGAASEAEATVSWRQLVSEATERLRRAGIDSPGIAARRIVERATGIDPADLHRALDEPATRRAVVHFDEMVERRRRGEPLQYVIGQWGFRTLDLHVDARVLIPRPETEVVAGLAIAEVEARAGSGREVVVADMGTGSGAIALSLAVECPRTRVYATDRSGKALAVARANLTGLGRAATRVSLHEGSWFDALPPTLRSSLDVVVSNPPYIADDEALPSVVADWEPPDALRAGPNGTEDIESLLDEAPRWLRPDGVLVIELAPHQAAAMAERARALGYDTVVSDDLTGRPRALVARR
jgi:release factor glutamine methyltransferase